MKSVVISFRCCIIGEGGVIVGRQRVWRRAMALAGVWRRWRARLEGAGMQRNGVRGCGHVARPPRLQNSRVGGWWRGQISRHAAIRQPQFLGLPWPYYWYLSKNYLKLLQLQNALDFLYILLNLRCSSTSNTYSKVPYGCSSIIKLLTFYNNHYFRNLFYSE